MAIKYLKRNFFKVNQFSGLSDSIGILWSSLCTMQWNGNESAGTTIMQKITLESFFDSLQIFFVPNMIHSIATKLINGPFLNDSRLQNRIKCVHGPLSFQCQRDDILYHKRQEGVYIGRNQFKNKNLCRIERFIYYK